MCFPLRSVLLLTQHSSSLVVSLHRHTPRCCKKQNNGPCGCLLTKTTNWLSSFIPRDALCCVMSPHLPPRAFASTALKFTRKPIWGNFAALLQPPAHWIISQHAVEPREFLNHILDRLASSAARKTIHKIDWAFFFCCVGLSCSQSTRERLSCSADEHNCLSATCLSVCPSVCLHCHW